MPLLFAGDWGGALVIHTSVLFFCMAGLFFCLLRDRFRFTATLVVTALTFLLSCVTGWGVGALLGESSACFPVTAAVGAGLFFLSSLPLYQNNTLQKLFVALLSVTNAVFLHFLLSPVLQALGLSVASVTAQVLAFAACVLCFFLQGLCLYHPLRHFSDRAPSGFLAGICVQLVLMCALSLGAADVLIRLRPKAVRAALVLALYGVLLFSVRSVYHAARFREQTTALQQHQQLLSLRSRDYSTLLTAVREVYTAEKAGEYALDTIMVLLADDLTEKIPEYMKLVKENARALPILKEYHSNPQLNALLAVRAAYCKQHEILFECNVTSAALSLPVSEVCLMTEELLARACDAAVQCTGERKVSMTIAPTEESLRMEVLYTVQPQAEEHFTLRGKHTEELVAHFFARPSQEERELHDLDFTGELCARYNGALKVSSIGTEEMMIQAVLKY